jgi:hypothetical protein
LNIVDFLKQLFSDLISDFENKALALELDSSVEGQTVDTDDSIKK